MTRLCSICRQEHPGIVCDFKDGECRQTRLCQPIRLWLDDIRDPYLYSHFGWVWAKDADSAIALLETGLVVEASLDHDLSDEHYPWNCPYPRLPDRGAKTGYDVVCWMEENQVWPVNGTRVHSQNPAGKARMEQIIRKCLYR